MMRIETLFRGLSLERPSSEYRRVEYSNGCLDESLTLRFPGSIVAVCWTQNSSQNRSVLHVAEDPALNDMRNDLNFNQDILG